MPAACRPPGDGRGLLADARRRDAVDLGLPEQEVVPDGDGRWTIELRADLPVEAWNAQISLLTGRAAAALMLAGGHGILRTLPAPDPHRFPRLRTAAEGLDVEWRDGDHPGDVWPASTTVPRYPVTAGLRDLGPDVLRVAGTRWSATPRFPDPACRVRARTPRHHAARRLRRPLRHRVCLALVAGTPLPDLLAEALPTLPYLMRSGDRAPGPGPQIIDAT